VARRGKLGARPHDDLKVSSCTKALYFDVVRLMNGRTNMSRFDVVVTHRAGRCSRQQPPRGATSSTPESPNEEQYRSILEGCKGKAWRGCNESRGIFVMRRLSTSWVCPPIKHSQKLRFLHKIDVSQKPYASLPLLHSRNIKIGCFIPLYASCPAYLHFRAFHAFVNRLQIHRLLA
jgi:hypothetical protein